MSAEQHVPDEMELEIAAGPAAVAATLDGLVGSAALELVAAAPVVLLLGTGASLAAALAARAAWAHDDRTTGRRQRVEVVESGEFVFVPTSRWDVGAVAVLVSKSGRSPETLEAARLLSSLGTPTIAVTAEGRSPLAETCDAVVCTPIGEETGAATKSALSALAALFALGGAIHLESPEIDARLASLSAAAGAEAYEAGRHIAGAGRVWLSGFGLGGAIADAASLLFHEKARFPAVASTPSGFRHGLVEASGAGDALVVLDCGDTTDEATRYFDLMRVEADSIGLRIITIGCAPSADLQVGNDEPAWCALRALIIVQRLTHSFAMSIGEYTDGFRVLRTHVRTSAPW